MIQIVKDSLVKFQTMDEFVLQPQSEIAKVREFVREIGYHIEKEDMIVEDGKFYPMMKVDRGKEKLNWSIDGPEWLMEKLDSEQWNKSEVQKVFDEYGEQLLQEKQPILLQYLQKEKELYQGILKNLMQMDTVKSELRQEEIKKKLKVIGMGLEWFEHEMQ